MQKEMSIIFREEYTPKVRGEMNMCIGMGGVDCGENTKPRKKKKKNSTEVFGEGYLAGYNQARVDEHIITQEEADAILKKAYKQREHT